MRVFAILCGAMLGGLALPAPAQAQAYQCRMPKTISVPKVTPRARPRRLPVTGYTLAASWSPEFCKRRARDSRHAMQCSGRNGRFAFIAHGLWPESRARWPQYCPTRRVVTPAVARPNMCMMPSARLLANQWAKHGSCMTRRPRTYFRIMAHPVEFDTLPRCRLSVARRGADGGQAARCLRGTQPGLAAAGRGAGYQPAWLAARIAAVLRSRLPAQTVRCAPFRAEGRPPHRDLARALAALREKRP